MWIMNSLSQVGKFTILNFITVVIIADIVAWCSTVMKVLEVNQQM